MIKTLEKKRWLAWLLTILITIEIFAFSSRPGTPIPGLGTNLVAVAYHLVVFFLFAIFLFIAIKGQKKLTLAQIILVLVICIAHAFLDEYHQAFTPFRDSSLRDVVIDITGSFFAIVVYSIINLRRLPHPRHQKENP